MTHDLKNAHRTAFLSVALLSVFFSFAYAESTQESAGGGGGDASSTGYVMKNAIADPAVGVSASANYTYDHGSLWFEEVPSVISPIPPPVGGGGGGSSMGGSSGSGWLYSLFGGGIEAPIASVPFTDMPNVAEALDGIAEEDEEYAVRAENAPVAVKSALRAPRKTPRIIRVVDEAGVTREINIILFKRITPWPLWLAFILLLIGAFILLLMVVWRGSKERLLWIGGAFIILGVIIGIMVRFAYRAVPIDPNAVVSLNSLSASRARELVMSMMKEMPLGAHVIHVTGASGETTLVIKVFITPALPI